MQRVLLKTFALLLVLLVVVIAHQHVRCISSAQASMVCLIDDPNEPNEPSTPGPESCLPGNHWTWLDVLPDANEPTEPGPEST